MNGTYFLLRHTIINVCLMATMIIGITSSGAFVYAQQNAVSPTSNKQDWNVYVANNPLECWIGTTPVKTVNTRGGQPVKVTRSATWLMVTNRPDSGVRGQVSFTGGYPLQAKQTIVLQIDQQKFTLPVVDGEWAWPESEDMDAKIITALKRGAKAVVLAESTRGTKTRDEFSLIGFTAAFNTSAKRCFGG